MAKADLRPLRPAGMADSGEPLPFSLNSRVAVADRAISFSDVNARLGGATVRGSLAFDGQTPRKVSGALDADTIDAAPLIASAIGMPAAVGNNGSAAWAWSSEPFGGGLFGAFNGEIALKARQVALLPRLTAREFRANLRFDKGGLAVDDATGDVSGGRLAGALSFRSAEDGLKAHGKISLTGVDAASLLPSAARPPVTGSLALSADVEGSGSEPGRADRLAARQRQDRAQRWAIGRPRSARFRRGHPRGGSRTTDRCGAHLRSGEQGLG